MILLLVKKILKMISGFLYPGRGRIWQLGRFQSGQPKPAANERVFGLDAMLSQVIDILHIDVIARGKVSPCRRMFAATMLSVKPILDG
jgi:hypothetical protein